MMTDAMIADDTIIALSSGALPAGIAVIRISGTASRTVLERLAGGVPPIRQASLRRIRDARGDTIDHALVLFFEGPATVTGEDLAELHLHGGRAVVAACLDAALALPDVRLAQAGEFTRRAFENGRIDLTEAEGLADLLSAETEAQRIQAVAQSGGALRALYEGWMKRLVHARAMLEASFDFADEGDVTEDVADSVRPALEALASEMRTHLAGAGRGEILRHGFKVAIIGPPNAGKSSLLNAVADREAAIVSPIAGTTRDVIEVALDLGGVKVRLFDTAGLRDTADAVEAIGIDRALATAEDADLILDLRSCEAEIHVKHPEIALPAVQSSRSIRTRTEHASSLVWSVKTKIDLKPERFGSGTRASDVLDDGTPVFALSAHTRTGLGALVEAIAVAATSAAGDPSALVPARTRHREIVSDALRLLDRTIAASQPPEFAADDLREITDRLGALTGRVGVEDLLDVIFSAFCIGK